MLLCTTASEWQPLTTFVPLGFLVHSILTIHCGQLCLTSKQVSYSDIAVGEMAAFIACTILISLGYFIGLKKCVLQPSTAVRFLGYICDCLKQAFILPQDKRIKFASLRESILEHRTVSPKKLAKVRGEKHVICLTSSCGEVIF